MNRVHFCQSIPLPVYPQHGLISVWSGGWLTGSQLEFFSVGGFLFSVAVGLFVLLLTNTDPQSQPQASHEVHRLRQPTHRSLSANDDHILACFVLKVQPPWLHFKVLVNFHLA